MNRPIAQRRDLIGFEVGCGSVCNAETMQRHMLHRIGLCARKLDRVLKKRHFHERTSQISALLRIVVKSALLFVQEPLARRVQFLEYVVDKRPRTSVNNLGVLAPLGADLLTAIAEPNRIGAEIYTLDLPLQVSPVLSLENVDLRVLWICPLLFCKRGGVESYPPGGLGGKCYVVVRTSVGVHGTGADRTCRLNISRLPGIRRIVIRIPGANLAFTVDEKLRELQPWRN